MTGLLKMLGFGSRNKFAGMEMPGSTECWAYLLSGLCLTLLCVGLFASQPGLDLNVSSKAFVDGRFPWFYDSEIHSIRRPVLWLIALFYAVTIYCGLKSFSIQKPVLRFEWHHWSFLSAAALAGPVLLINVILKGNWGRARPMDVTEFGGAANFTPFWEFTDQCSANCSFASGEVSAVAMLFSSLAMISTKRNRFLILLTGLAATILVAILRIGMGAHFLSDTIMAVALMLIIASITYSVFFLRDHNWIDRMNAAQAQKIQKEKP
ncbi:MAG: phosphatase PAP2 family protein [Pseudomonadota bacterium]